MNNSTQSTTADGGHTTSVKVLTREDLKKEIRAFLDKYPASDEMDIAQGVWLPFALTIELCDELRRDGKIKVVE